MSAISISSPFPTFTDVDGDPLESGYIYVGQANVDPVTFPIAVYWDAALTIPAVQPIRTIGGYPARNGSPARIYANSDYSIRVTNKNGSLVYSAPAATDRFSGVVVDVDAADVAYTPAGTGAVATTVQSKLLESVSVKDFGAVGDGVTDDTAAIQAAIDSINPYEHQVASVSQTPFSAVILLPRGTYNVSTIEHRNGVILRGEGGTNLVTTRNAPVIRQAANTYTNPLNPLQTHSAYGIESLTIYGSNDPQTGLNTLQDGIYLGYDDRYNSASHSFIRDVVITSMQGNGIKLHKPAVANDQWGWTQFGKWSNVLITSCAGYGFIASGVTGKADFSSMLLEQFFVGACYSGGISISGGNDNRIQGTSASIGFTRGLTNLSADDSVVLNDLLFTDLDIHIESPANQSSYGVNIGKTAQCYATSIRGLFDGTNNPIKITSSNGCKLDNLMFQDVPAGNYCILNYGRYTEIGKNWYQNTTGALFLNDQVANPAIYAATGYITPNALTFGPTNLYTSSNDYPNNISANGVAIGLGGSTSSTKVGKDALKVATGGQNTALGYQAGLAVSTGANNTAVGTNSLIGATTASNGTAVGQNSLLSATGGNNTAVGASAGLNVTTGTNNVLLGYVAGTDAVLNVTTQSNQVVVGNNLTTNATIKVAWTVTSDARDKTNFAQIPYGLDFVNNLKPVCYQFKVSRDSDEVSGPRRYGFLAQDILAAEGADPVIVNAEDSENLKYTESYLIPVLVNSIKELSKRIDELEART